MNTITIPVITSDVTGLSIFKEVEYSVEDYNGLMISERQGALNFRYRISEPGYFSTWHVAGDPTLIIIRSGTLRMTLRNGEYRDFSSGDLFIAQDKLDNNEVFDQQKNGHTAELIGEQLLQAVHIKLSKPV